jgi:hypothetical protein
MSATGYIAGLTLTAVGAGAFVFETAAGPQDWTVLALLAAVVLGIGGKLVHTAEKQVTVVGELATNIKLLAAQMAEDTRTRTSEWSLLKADLHQVPAKVADEIGRIVAEEIERIRRAS